jgi:GNAT superfamily N-acetyltransferase
MRHKLHSLLQEPCLKHAPPNAPESDPRIRRLTRRDQPLLRDHLLRLDPVSRYDRFGMSVNDAFLTNYAAHCFDEGDLVFGFFEDGVLRGAGEMRGLGPQAVGDAAEAAFSVEKAWRGHGVGSALLARIVQTARNIGATTLYLTCLAHNRAMQNIVRKSHPSLLLETDRKTGRLIARERPDGEAVPPQTRWRESFSDNNYSATLDLGG